jgi:hypothetical protein
MVYGAAHHMVDNLEERGSFGNVGFCFFIYLEKDKRAVRGEQDTESFCARPRF